MPKLRFPNPGSDIDRMTHVFCLVASAAEHTHADTFGLDFMTDVATAEGQASSQGAQGAIAVMRSRRDDRSRDPLYNQLKMYSEIYRMLGWLRPAPDSRLTFVTTLLGMAVMDAAHDAQLRAGLIRESLLAIVFPNTTTENLGVVSQRPFSWLLQLAAALDGVITRHEMILGLLAQVDDRLGGGIGDTADRIRALRDGPISQLRAEAATFAAQERVQLNTLENYTRFPVGVLASSSVGWGVAESIPQLYKGRRPVAAIRLTEAGTTAAARVQGMTDVRVNQLQSLTPAERACFASATYYALLQRAGFTGADITQELARHSAAAANGLRAVGSTSPIDILFSPFVQESDEVLELAQEKAGE